MHNWCELRPTQNEDPGLRVPNLVRFSRQRLGAALEVGGLEGVAVDRRGEEVRQGEVALIGAGAAGVK